MSHYKVTEIQIIDNSTVVKLYDEQDNKTFFLKDTNDGAFDGTFDETSPNDIHYSTINTDSPIKQEELELAKAAVEFCINEYKKIAENIKNNPQNFSLLCAENSDFDTKKCSITDKNKNENLATSIGPVDFQYKFLTNVMSNQSIPEYPMGFYGNVVLFGNTIGFSIQDTTIEIDYSNLTYAEELLMLSGDLMSGASFPTVTDAGQN